MCAQGRTRGDQPERLAIYRMYEKVCGGEGGLLTIKQARRELIFSNSAQLPKFFLEPTEGWVGSNEKCELS